MVERVINSGKGIQIDPASGWVELEKPVTDLCDPEVRREIGREAAALRKKLSCGLRPPDGRTMSTIVYAGLVR